MTQINTKHSGAEWVKSALKMEMSPLGEAVASLLGEWQGGIYHVQTRDLAEVEWDNDHHVILVLRDKSLSTFDNDSLTRLVFLCHDYALRCELSARSPKHHLELMFHQRERDGGVWERHPTIEQALEVWRKYHPEKMEA